MEIKHKILLGLGTVVILWLTEYLSLGVITVCAVYLITIAVNQYPTISNRADDKKYSLKLDWLENKTIAEGATLKLRDIFETLEKMLAMEEFEEDLQAELSAAYPNYTTVLKTAKDDLLRKDCSIVIAGATSSGKSTLLNTLIGRQIFPVSNVASTFKVCRVRNSEVLCVKTFDRDEKLIKEETVDSELILTEVLQNYSDKSPAEMANIFYIDVHLPVDILKGNIIIVDTPGIGETDELDEMLLDFLPSALSMIFMVDASNGGGVQKDRLLKIFHEVLKNLDTMPCFDPREVIFLTNKWDAIKKEITVGVNEHDKTWNTIIEKLKNEWANLTEENVFKVSLEQGKSGAMIFTNELTRFEVLLQETIQRNQNKRIKHHFSFLEDFTQNAERGTLARLQFNGLSYTKQQESISRNTRKIEVLQNILRSRKVDFETHNKETTTRLTSKLYDYLNSEKTKEQIMYPKHDIAIAAAGIINWRGILNTRFEKAIQDWLHGEEMKNIVTEVHEKMTDLLQEVESKLDEIKMSMIGYKSPLRSNDICDNFMSESVTIVYGVSGFSLLELVVTEYVHFVVSLFSDNNDKNPPVEDKLFRTILESLSLDRIHKCFKNSFSKEYEKRIKTIFDIRLKQKVDTLTKTNHQLDIQQETIRQKQHSYESLHEIIQKIERESDAFIATIKKEDNK